MRKALRAVTWIVLGWAVAGCGDDPCGGCAEGSDAYESCRDALVICDLFGPTPLRASCRNDVSCDPPTESDTDVSGM
jgi:hypothetical protein